MAITPRAGKDVAGTFSAKQMCVCVRVFVPEQACSFGVEVYMLVLRGV